MGVPASPVSDRSPDLDDDSATEPGRRPRTPVDLVALGRAVASDLRSQAGLTTPCTESSTLRALATVLDQQPSERQYK